MWARPRIKPIIHDSSPPRKPIMLQSCPRAQTNLEASSLRELRATWPRYRQSRLMRASPGRGDGTPRRTQCVDGLSTGLHAVTPARRRPPLGLLARLERRLSSGRETDCRVTTAAITSGRSGPWSLRATKVATDHCRPPHSSQTSTDITCAARCTHATVSRNTLMVPTPTCVYSPW